MKRFLERIAPIWAPHPGQRRFLEAAASIRVLACGRRWGKTDACAVLLLQGIETPGQTKRLIVAPTLDQSLLLFERTIDLLERIESEAIPRSQLRLGSKPRLDWNGHRIVARSGHRGRSLRGMEADLIVVDEAAYVDQNLLGSVLSPMLATTDGMLVLVSTPNGYNEFWRMFRRASGDPSIYAQTGPSEENPRVSKAFLENQRSLFTDRVFRAEYLAEFVEISGAVFREASLQACIVPETVALPGAPVSIGVDWGAQQDYTACVALQRQGDVLAVLECDRVRQAPTSEGLCAIVQTMAARYPGASIHADSTSLQRVINDVFRRTTELPIGDFDFTRNSKAKLVEHLVWLVETQRIRIPNVPMLLEEMRNLAAIPKGHDGAMRYEATTGHDDLVMALGIAALKVGAAKLELYSSSR